MADSGYITASQTGISQRTTVYAERQMLKHAMPVMVLDKFGKPYRMPENKTRTVKFRRPIPFDPKTTPLVEGVTPDRSTFAYEDVAATLNQYGDWAEITDVIADTHEDPVLNDLAEMMGENIGRTIERLNWLTVRAGTSVYYANGSARSSVNTAISLSKQRAVTAFLKNQKAKKLRSILAPSTNYATRAIEASYVAVAHTNVENDIRNMTGFIPTAEYGQRRLICDEEIGAVDDCRYVVSPDLNEFADGGGVKAGMISTTGTYADVYPVVYFGADAWVHIALRGKRSITPHIEPPGRPQRGDELGQRGFVSWKTWHAALITNDLWMCRLEVAATDLA